MVDGGREGHRGEMADAGDRQSVDTGLRAGAAIGRGGGVDIFGRRFCSEVLTSEVLAMTRAICSWLALSRSTAFTWTRAIRSWLALSCSIDCPMVARSRAIDWSNCVNSGDRAAAVGAGATSSDAACTGCGGAAFATAGAPGPRDPARASGGGGPFLRA